MSDPYSFRDIQTIMSEKFRKVISYQTARNVAKKLDLTPKKCQTKGSGSELSPDELVDLMMGFIREVKAKRLFFGSPEKIWSIDLTTTKMVTKNVTTLSPKGSGKQKAKIYKGRRYTNSIVTCVCGAGGNPTPSILFTYNPIFDKDHRSLLKRQDLIDKCLYYGIGLDRIVFKKAPKAGKTYCSESSEMYEHALQRYLESGKMNKGDLVLHDNGVAFKKQNLSIFDGLGLNHKAYLAAVHQYLSPNDNKLHGVKEQWRSEFYKLKNDLDLSLRLMQLLDETSVAKSRDYFNGNLFHLTNSKAKAMIRE